jgi:Lamin Tail Domain
MPTRRWILVCALVVTACAGVALAEAGIPGPDGVINACRKIDGGRLRAVARTSHCRPSERPLKWNVQGPAGPAGAAGATGAQGPVGPQGPTGPGIEAFEDLEGLGCTLGANSGTIEIEFDAATGAAHIRCVVPAGPPALVRINEFSTGVEGALTDEFVEIVNSGSSSLDLSGWKLVYRSAAGTSDVSLGTLPDGTVLAAGAFLLFGGSGYAGAHPADRSFSTSIASAGGGIGLRNAAGILADSVAWGTATNAFVEGTVAVAPTIAVAPGKSDGRHPDGHDTDVNSADFSEDDPTPGGAN